MDRYTRFILTTIAVMLLGNLLLQATHSDALIGRAEAQGVPNAPLRVVIVGWSLAPTPGAPLPGFPVRLTGTAGNVPVIFAGTEGTSVPVNVVVGNAGKPIPVTVQNGAPIQVIVKPEPK